VRQLREVGPTLIQFVLPPQVSAVEAHGDDPDPVLCAEEEELVAAATPGRRAEFATTRRCARDALAHLGHLPTPIGQGPRREPLWPDGTLGSLTHCARYRAAAVALRSTLTGLGIDAEPHEPLPPGVDRLVVVQDERPMLARLHAGRPDVYWDRVLFCAKEAVYKAWYPAARTWLGFDDVSVTLDPVARSFTATLLRPWPTATGITLGALPGRFAVEAGLILACATIPPATVLVASPASTTAGRAP